MRSRHAIRGLAFAAALAAGAAGAQPMTGPAPLPPGAIRIGEDSYMVPAGADADGCARYRMFSRESGVPDAIFYADGQGGFTRDRARADCAGAKP